MPHGNRRRGRCRLVPSRSSVRSIADGLQARRRRSDTGCRGTTAGAADDVTTTTTPPIINACTTARSALSAKNSRKTKMTPALTNRTDPQRVGITPSAPWMRSVRAVSRSVRWSRYLSKAACSEGERGSVVPRLRKIGDPQGLAHRRASPTPSAATRDARRRARNRRARRTPACASAAGRNWAVSNCCATSPRLRLGAAARGVEALEGEEDDEARAAPRSRSRSRRTRPPHGRRPRSSRPPAHAGASAAWRRPRQRSPRPRRRRGRGQAHRPARQ